MADTKTYTERGLGYERNTMHSVPNLARAAAAISPNRLLEFDSSGLIQHATEDSILIVGASGPRAYDSGDPVEPIIAGPANLTADAPVSAGQLLKAGDAGVAMPLVTAAEAGTTIDSSTGGDFGNQPANDGIEVLSSDAGDTTQTVTVWGTTTGTDTVVTETIALDGTTPVPSVKLDWGQILGVELSASCDGTVTVQEASGGADITTILTTVLTAGIVDVPAADQYAYNVPPTAVAGGASTKQIGLVGTNPAGTTIYDSQALNGTTAVTMNVEFNTVTRLLVGDVAAASTVTVAVGAAETTTGLAVARALQDQATVGDTFLAKIL